MNTENEAVENEEAAPAPLTLEERCDDTCKRHTECCEQGGTQIFVDVDVFDALFDGGETDVDQAEHVANLRAEIASLNDRLKEATENLAQYHEDFANAVEAGIQEALDTVNESKAKK